MTVINRVFRDDNVAVAVFGASMIITGCTMGKHTVMMKWFQNWHQKYKPDNPKEPVPVRNVINFRYDNVLNDMNVSAWDRQYYKLFVAKKVLEPFGMGCTHMRNGITIGIPEYFQQGTDEGIINTNILIGGKPVDWSSEDGQKLLQTFKLSENAQKYILAKCITINDNFYFIIKSLLPTFLMVGGYSTAYKIYKKLRLDTRSDAYILLLYAGVVLVFGLLYAIMVDGIHLQYDSASEERVSELGHGYIIGCIEYNQQIVERNKILRRIMKNGHRRYLENGDESWKGQPIGLPPSLKIALAKERIDIEAETEEIMKIPPVNPNPHPIL